MVGGPGVRGVYEPGVIHDLVLGSTSIVVIGVVCLSLRLVLPLAAVLSAPAEVAHACAIFVHGCVLNAAVAVTKP